LHLTKTQTTQYYFSSWFIFNSLICNKKIRRRLPLATSKDKKNTTTNYVANAKERTNRSIVIFSMQQVKFFEEDEHYCVQPRCLWSLSLEITFKKKKKDDNERCYTHCHHLWLSSLDDSQEKNYRKQ
jgi:hypothetical protein